MVVVICSGQKVTHGTGNCVQSFPDQATHGTGSKQNFRSSNPKQFSFQRKDKLHLQIGPFKPQKQQKTARTPGHRYHRMDLCEYGTLSSDFCASSDKDLMIVTGHLQC